MVSLKKKLLDPTIKHTKSASFKVTKDLFRVRTGHGEKEKQQRYPTRGTLLKKKRVRKRKTIVTEGEPRPETLLKKKQQPETRRERRTLLKEKQQWERPC